MAKRKRAKAKLQPEPALLRDEAYADTWYHWVQSEFSEFTNPDVLPIRTYEEMLKDETVSGGMEFMRRSILARLGEYSHPVARIDRFARECLVGIPGFLSSAAEMLTCLEFGFSATEMLFGRGEDGKIRPRGLQTLHPDSITLELATSGTGKNKPKAVWQWKGTARAKELPLQKVVLATHGGAFGNAYGQSRLRAAYAAWFTKRVIVPMWGQACEQFGSPIAMGQTDSEKKVRLNGEELSAKAYLAKRLSKLGANRQLVTDTATKITLYTPPAGLGKDIEGLVAYCNKMIFRAIGLPSLIADHGTVGSQALGKEHSSHFHLILEGILYEFTDTLVQQFMRPIITWNFGEQKLGYGAFAVENFDPEKALQLAQYLGTLLEHGIVRKDKLGDFNECRAQLGWVPYTEAEFEEALSLPTPSQADSTPPENEDDLSPEELSAQSELALCFSSHGRRRAKAALAVARKRTSQARQLAQFKAAL